MQFPSCLLNCRRAGTWQRRPYPARRENNMQHRLVLKFVLALSLCGTWSATAQDYFPLQVGNQWVYKTGGSRSSAPLVLEILRTAEFGGTGYVNLHSSAGGDYWLRRHDDGSVWQYDQT